MSLRVAHRDCPDCADLRARAMAACPAVGGSVRMEMVRPGGGICWAVYTRAQPKRCPRCGGIADEARTDKGFPRPGALSRWDNRTIVCSACGTDEAVRAARGLALDPHSPARPWAFPPRPLAG
jgi:hypothetical protein